MVPPESSPFWQKAETALKECQARYIAHPAVTMIDLGLIGHSQSPSQREAASQSIGIRIHLYPQQAEAAADFPTEIDGVPVRCITGDYKAEDQERETLMSTNKNLKREVIQEDNLRDIDGIGPKFAQALIAVGITNFETLASFTSDSLYHLLRESTDVKITPDRIVDKDWIGQARAMAEEAVPTGLVDPGEKVVHYSGEEGMIPETVPEPMSDLLAEKFDEVEKSETNWHQHAGFSLFFELGHERGESGSIWQTRIYHDESGEETVLSGMQQADWADWITERVQKSSLKPNVDSKTDKSDGESDGESVVQPALPKANLLNQYLKKPIFEVELNRLDFKEMAQQATTTDKRLNIEIDFMIKGKDAEKLIEQSAGFVLEVEGEEVSGRTLLYHESSNNRLGEDRYQYHLNESLPFPMVGRYNTEISLIFDMPYGPHKEKIHQLILNIVP